jgi:hypothetical protein
MGTWNKGILESDEASDIHDALVELCDDGMSVKKASKEVMEQYAEELADPEHGHLYWFGLAMAQLKQKKLDPVIHNKVIKLIADGVDEKQWLALGGSEEELPERRQVISEFIEQLEGKRSLPEPLPFDGCMVNIFGISVFPSYGKMNDIYYEEFIENLKMTLLYGVYWQHIYEKFTDVHCTQFGEIPAFFSSGFSMFPPGRSDYSDTIVHEQKVYIKRKLNYYSCTITLDEDSFFQLEHKRKLEVFRSVLKEKFIDFASYAKKADPSFRTEEFLSEMQKRLDAINFPEPVDQVPLRDVLAMNWWEATEMQKRTILSHPPKEFPEVWEPEKK